MGGFAHISRFFADLNPPQPFLRDSRKLRFDEFTPLWRYFLVTYEARA
jgi:hypothetical protein